MEERPWVIPMAFLIVGGLRLKAIDLASSL